MKYRMVCLKLFIILSIAYLTFFPRSSYSTLPVIDTAALIQLGNQLTQLQQQTVFIETELKRLNTSQYAETQQLINQLGSIVSATNGISYSAANIDSQFRQAYPGYKPPQNYTQQYRDNTATTLNTLNGVLQSMSASAQDFQNENSRLSYLQQQSQSAQGQTQAIQASSQIASEMVSQIQILRQTIIAQSNAQTAYYANQVQKEASAKSEADQVIAAGSTVVPEYGSSGHPLNPPTN